MTNPFGKFDFAISVSSDNKITLTVEAKRLMFQWGDIARAISPAGTVNGFCKKTTNIGPDMYLITGGVGYVMEKGYRQMCGYRLVPIDEFGGQLQTHEELNEKSKWVQYRASSYGLIVKTPAGECVVTNRVTILPYDESA